MERISEFWGDWWKLAGIIVLIVAAIWMVHSCQQGERSRFLDCLDTSIGGGETLYYGGDAYYNQVNRDDAVAAAKKCYDDSSIDPNAERPDWR